MGRAAYGDARLPARFWVKVSSEPNSGCWLWLGCVSTSGYGHWGLRGRTVYAHRAAYEMLVGAIPSGLHLDHLCRVRTCVNPAHLEAVTQAENNRRTSKGECKRGHPSTPENAYWRPDRPGVRECLACIRIRSRIA